MLKVTLRSFWEHKRRLVLTVISIVLGVSFMAATFVLGDTFNRFFDDLFSTGGEKVDAQVEGDVTLSDPFSGQDERAPLPESMVEQVAAVPGVRVAEPYVITIGFGTTNRVLGPDGKALGAAQGPPTLLESWRPHSQLSAYRVEDGRGPEADDEIALDLATFEDSGYELGDTVTVVTLDGNKDYTLVGTVRFGTAKSSGGALSAEFTLAEAQRLADLPGQVDQVVAGAEPGVSQEELAGAIREALPKDVHVLTGKQASDQLSSDVQSGFSIITTIIQVFAGIALLVGIFVITNTFSIIVQQRTRELALLRAVGAGRRQVLTSVLLEAILVGLIGAGLGLLVGVGLATASIAGFGADLGGIVLSGKTVGAALLIGLVVTLVSALAPAIRATRVPPLAALRDVAIDRSGASRARVALGVLITLAAAFLLSTIWTGDNTTDDIAPIIIGALLVLVAAVIVGPVLAGPSVLLGGKPLAKLSGITGRLAVENASRSPKRTSATAAALLIGVALVGLLSVFGASAKASIDKVVSRGFNGDFVVQAESSGFGPGIGGFSPAIAEQVVATEGVATVAPQALAGAHLVYPDGDEADEVITAMDPSTLTGTLEPTMAEGAVTDLTDDGVIVDVERAREHGISLGDKIHFVLSGGEQLDLRVAALSDEENLLGFFTMTRATYQANAKAPLDTFLYGTVDDGADVDVVVDRVDEAVAATPGLQVLDKEGFIGSIADQVSFFLNFITILLLLSIVIALIGVANTLSLSISERVRELGLLRAVGMDRVQLKRSIRWEAILIAMLGTTVGVALSVGLGWALMEGFASQGFTEFRVPVGSLVVLLVAGAGVGTLAAILPARRAAKLSILDAIATD
ncbi:MAG: ABC transporter permease [Acidimicrobiales bacterium]